MTNNHAHNTYSYASLASRLRPVLLVTALAFAWTFVCLPLAQAAQPAQPSVKAATIKLPVLKIYPAPVVDRNLRKPGPPLPLFPYKQVEAEREQAGLLLPKAVPKAPALQHSLLNGVEYFNCSVALLTPKAWKAEMSTSGTSPERLAQLHIWYGEWELAKNEQPAIARWHYRMALHLTAESDSLHGLAAYDDAMATFYEGAYREATRSFSVLANTKTALPGYPFKDAQGWLRHSIACAAYHSERSEAGIPEPVRLDPYCGAAGLAIALRGMGKPYDKSTIARACRITGQGSNLQDLIDAGPKLGLSVRAVGADDKGLMALPKPIIAHVEFDHFITVVKADKQGVTYICSDCGPWPGGQVNLTWKQWHMLNPGVYGAITTPGSAWDKTLAAANSAFMAPIIVGKVASRIPLTSLGGRDFRFVTDHLSLLRGHIFKSDPPVLNACTGRPTSTGCPPNVLCPTSSPPDPGPGTPTCGDPVNLATLEENYTPPADLTVYNPVGPSVVWERNYRSERSAGNGFEDGDSGYEANDFGIGWSQSYNISVFDSTNGGTGSKALLLADGSVVGFTANSTPSPGSPVQCIVTPGSNMLVEWDYSASSPLGTYKVTMADRSQMIFGPVASGTQSYLLSQIVDRSGNAIALHYGPPAGGSYTLPLLSSISNSAGTTLLAILRAPDGTGNIWSIVDCYGRAVYYDVGDYSASLPTRLLDHVSQVVPACSQNAPDRYVYDYAKVAGAGGTSFKAFYFYDLHSITVPSPSGAGSAQALINYDPRTDQVASLTDANGNTIRYYSTDAAGAVVLPSGYTTVKQYDSSNTLLYQYTVGFDSNMSQTTITNGSGVVTSTSVFSDPNDPDLPSTVTDAFGHAASFTYDTFGNILTATDPRGTVTTNTVSYTNFALGEVTSTQTGSKQATTISYYEPSGNVQQVNMPAPGTVGGGGTVSANFTYDTLGNLTSATGPGNATASTITTTLGYTTDGSFSQPEALGQPITVTDNLGKTTHLRYDPQGNTTSVIDALANETDVTYNIVNDPINTILPATGESGNGHGYSTASYLYPGGPLTARSLYDESGSLIRAVNTAYGLDGETVSVSGSTEPVSYTYDGLYRLKTLTDGNGHTTSYNYNANGWLAGVAYPNANLSTGYDTVSYPSYDALGDALKRIDGRGIETDYTYSDPDNLLTYVSYPSSTSLNANYSYDQYGRISGVTDGATASSSGPGIIPSYDDDDDTTSVQTTYIGQTAGTYLPTQTISYTYSPDGSTATTVTPAGTFTYGFDGVGRPNTLTNPFSETTNWTYLDNGWLKSRVLPNGVTTTNSFNALGQLLDMVSKNAGSAILSDFNIPTTGGYDGAGNLLSRADTITAQASYSGATSYQYDTKDQLTQEVSTRLTGYTNNFVYDGGNVTGPGNPTTFKAQTNTFNADNQYANSGYAYDGDGNPTTYNGASLSFDAEDRMTAFGTALTNGYLESGLRAWKQNSAGTRTYFLYDGLVPVCELNSSGNVTATNTFGADGLISRNTVSGSTFYTFDFQGGDAQRLDSSGSVLASAIFDSNGSRISTDASPDPFSGYGARWDYYTDSETGLGLCTYRFYDAANGRFINRDPLGINGGINLYSYCHGNSVNAVDPLGWSPVLAIAGGGTLIAGGGVMTGGFVATGTGAAFLFGLGTGVAIGGAAMVGWGIGTPIGNWAASKMSGVGTASLAAPDEIDKAGLPKIGPFPYIPPKSWKPGNSLPKEKCSGRPKYRDNDGNLWQKGPNHHFPDQPFEWDVTGKGIGGHLNVNPETGEIK